MKGSVSRGVATALLLAWAGIAARAEEEPTPPPRDPRTREWVSLVCASEIGSSTITLFANGTVRLREERLAPGEEEPPELWLAELDPDELAAYRNRLAEIDLSEDEAPRYGASGEWVEQCTLVLELPGSEPRRFRFGRYDSLPLNLSRLVRVVRELGDEALARDARAGLPVLYVPRRGDILIDGEGGRFEVVRETAEGRGVELVAVDSPLVLYFAIDQLRSRFVALERREPE
jgi:hypothetical protein